MRKQPGGSGANPYAQLVEDAEGLDKIESLQARGGLGVGGWTLNPRGLSPCRRRGLGGGSWRGGVGGVS